MLIVVLGVGFGLLNLTVSEVMEVLWIVSDKEAL
jgi:hypothetical protein